MFEFLKREKRPAPTLPDGTVRRHYFIYGQVQGVGFRYRAMYAARTLGLTGWVENMEDGSVEMEVQGQPEQIDEIFPMIQSSDYIFITDIRHMDCEPNPHDRSFSVRGY